MSSVGGVSSSNASLFQYLNTLASNPNSAGAASGAVENSQLSALMSLLETNGTTDPSEASPYTSTLGAASGSAATSGAGGSSDASGSSTAGSASAAGTASSATGSSSGISLTNLRTQIETAVNGAISNLGGSVLSDPGAAAQAVRSAINSALQQDGIATGASSSGTAPASFGSAAPSRSSQISSSGSASGADSAASSNASASSLSASNAGSSLLDSLLAQNNIDPTNFQNNLLSSLANSSNGGVDLGQLFQNFPSGQDIDTLV